MYHARITRVDAKGGMLTEPLAGEQEVLQRFTEAINKVGVLCHTRVLSL
jgi:hypothetical protein